MSEPTGHYEDDRTYVPTLEQGSVLDAVRAVAAEEDRDEWDAAERLGRIRDLLGTPEPRGAFLDRTEAAAVAHVIELFTTGRVRSRYAVALDVMRRLRAVR